MSAKLAQPLYLTSHDTVAAVSAPGQLGETPNSTMLSEPTSFCLSALQAHVPCDDMYSLLAGTKDILSLVR